MNPTERQTIVLTQLLERHGGVMEGTSIRGAFKARGYNLWQSSIFMSKMVKTGVVDVVRGMDDVATGHTWRKKYGLTDAGRGVVAVIETREMLAAEAIDLEPTVEKAISDTGKWKMLPEGVNEDQIDELKQRGFKVRMVISYDLEGEGKL